MGRPLEKYQLGRSIQKWEENSKIILKEIFHNVVGTVHIYQVIVYKLVQHCMY
jgi:hypothetical protein